MRVIKTLVIGLGSSGTHICDAIAKRIEWEFQELNKVPWVRFLCIETNENQKSVLNQRGDFRVIKINADQFQEIIENPKVYDESIALSDWADTETLKKLPGNEVAAGAGNIRMVGRLAFLFQTNYDNIKYAITERLTKLRELTEQEALEACDSLSNGTNSEIEFAAGREVRVFVIGTLCGGTCSGLVSDFGFFLKDIAEDAERIVGIFTIPRHDLTSTMDPNASRYKRNAYSALLELNHYHLADRVDEPPIRFPDGIKPNTQVFPYDLTYLMVPRQLGEPYVDELNRAAADRIFLNIFVPETDPFAKSVDAPIFDREHRAHVFCSVGLSTVEFPAQQVIEACTKKQLLYAINEWINRSLDDRDKNKQLEEIGLTWDTLKKNLMNLQGGSSLDILLNQKVSEVLSLARSNVSACEKSLDQLRDAFKSCDSTQDRGLYPGIVPQTFDQNRSSSVEEFRDRLRSHIQVKLLKFYDGPARLRQLLIEAMSRINEVRGSMLNSFEEHASSVDDCIRKIKSYHHSPLLRIFLLRGTAIERVLPVLSREINEEVKSRTNLLAHQALLDKSVSPGPRENGVLTKITKLLQTVQKRVDNFMSRITRLSNDLRRETDRLARTDPVINGFVIFESENSSGGTVKDEYQRCLSDAAKDATTEWQQQRDIEAEKIIASWDSLPFSVLPYNDKREDDWLLKDYNPNSNADQPIPLNDFNALERIASQPFLRLREVDVLTRWRNINNESYNPIASARSAAQDAMPFLTVSPVVAVRGGRSPIVERRIVLTPQSTYRQDFLDAISPEFSGDFDRGDSPDHFRCVILEEWYRFPLSGVPSVLGNEGIHAAKCTDFPNFHTRKDVFWVGMSDSEIEAIRKAEQIVIVGVLLSLLQPKRGALEFPWGEGGFDGATERRLPLSIRGASRYLAFADNDLDGYSIKKGVDVLSHRINQCIGEKGMDDHQANIEFLKKLANKLHSRDSFGIPDWDHKRASRLVTQYCARNDGLYKAFVEVFPPDTATITRLRKNVGDQKPGGGTYDSAGLYCSECGGLVGRDEQDAARNGWRCYINPSHYYGVKANGD